MHFYTMRVRLMRENRAALAAMVGLALEPYRKAILNLHKKH